jgi:hypothetical protein
MSEYISENTSESMSPSLSVPAAHVAARLMHAALRLAVPGLRRSAPGPSRSRRSLTGEQMREGDVRQRRQWWSRSGPA